MARPNSCLITILAVIFLPVIAFAVPTPIPYSGQLSENGLLVTGTRDLVAKLYNVATSGTPIYSESFSGTTVQNGVYHLMLNAPAGVWDGADRWLGVSVNGGAELAPRMKIGSVPYAMRATIADSTAQVPTIPHAWQVVFAEAVNIGAGAWGNVGPELQITTSGGPLLIVVDVYANGGSHATFQPLVDGVWAGSYSSMLSPGDPYWKEGLLFMGSGTWQQWNKSKIYSGIPAGTHVVRIQGATDGGTLTVGNTSVPCSLQVIELQSFN